MEVKATVKIKIPIIREIAQTVKVYIRCLQLCIDTAWDKKIKNNVTLHPFVYKQLRNNGLPSQLAIACIKQACGMVKKARTKPIIKKTSMRYNFPRSAHYKNNILRLSTIHGRITCPVLIPQCYREYFSWKLCESLLRMDKRGRCFFLFVFSRDALLQVNNKKTLGIDLGIHNLAVTSAGQFFNASPMKQMKRKYKYLRSTLQAKGTRSATRLLQKLQGRERRFMAWVNHRISKRIVDHNDGSKIVMENLKGIRKLNRGKRMNYWLSNWSFYQLQQFITYKAQRKGMTVVKVSPYLTSQMCSRCGNIGTRKKHSFHCQCGLKINADLNASRNLAQGISFVQQGVVNHPYISDDETKAVLTELRLSSEMISITRSGMPYRSAVVRIASGL